MAALLLMAGLRQQAWLLPHGRVQGLEFYLVEAAHTLQEGRLLLGRVQGLVFYTVHADWKGLGGAVDYLLEWANGSGLALHLARDQGGSATLCTWPGK